MKPDINEVWKALEKYGIKSEKELDEAIKNMNPINIGCMVSPINKNVRERERDAYKDKSINTCKLYTQ